MIDTIKHVEVLRTVHQGLTAYPGLALMAGKMFNSLPQGLEKPYIRYRWANPVDWSTKTSFGYDGEVTVDVWSNQPGDEEILSLSDLVVLALHNREDFYSFGLGPLLDNFGDEIVDNFGDPILVTTRKITGGRVVLLQHVRTNFIVEPDGVSKHAVIIFRLIASN